MCDRLAPCATRPGPPHETSLALGLPNLDVGEANTNRANPAARAPVSFLHADLSHHS